MAGSGQENDIIFAKNADFSGSSTISSNNGITSDNQIWLGRSAAVGSLSQIDVMQLVAGTGMSLVRAGAGVPGTPGTLTINNTGSLTDYHDTRFIVSAGGAANGANYTTIASAITAASSAGGVQDIFIQPGSYTENLTWPANINLCAHIGDRNTPTVTIIGKLTCTDAGSRSASGIRFQTNSDNILSITGTANTQVTFDNCFINATNATAFNSTTTGATSLIRCNYCVGDLATTGIAYVTIAHGFFRAQWCDFRNSGGSTTASTISSDATCDIIFTNFSNIITHSSSSLSSIWYSAVRAGAATCLTTSGTGTVSCKFSRFESQTASSISIGSGTIVTAEHCSFDSSNANVITGAGTLQHTNNSFTSTSSDINPTTATALYSNLGKYRATGQPAFLAYLNTSVTNVSGDGTTYTVIFDTEVFDQDSNFNLGTSTFTAPITGRYQLHFVALFVGGTTINGAFGIINTSNRTYRINLPLAPAVTTTAGGTISVIADMDAADTATFQMSSTDGGGKIDDVAGTTGGIIRTFVSGTLAC